MNDEATSLPEPPPEHTLHVQQLFVRHQQAVLAYVLSIEPNLADAQDIVQEVFLVVTRKAATWTAGTNFLAWACTIARYETLRFQRASTRRVARLDEDVVELLHGAVENDERSHETRLAALRQCLSRLAPRARELITRRYHQGEMPERIAPAIGWSVNAVRVALTRARQALRRCLEQQLARNCTP